MKKKYVIWGQGKRGKLTLEILGADRVCAFIDSDVNIQGTSYRGIPVISYDDYKRKYKDCIIIVTPKGSEQKIINILHNDGIYMALPFDMFEMQWFLRQLPLDRVTRPYRKTEQISIYGFNLLGVLMWDYFCRKGYPCNFIVPNGFDRKIGAGLKRCVCTSNIQDVYPRQRVLLATNLEEEDREILDRFVVVEDYSDLRYKDELYCNPQLEKFRNIHLGERCFIVATGPSLTVEDLNRLYENREVCISVNGIFKVFDKTAWRPDYYTIGDEMGVALWKDEILKMDVKEKFVSDVAWQFGQNEPVENIYKWHMRLEWKEGVEPEFSDDFAKKSYTGYTVVYDAALQLAVYMGFKEIYLLGTDCTQGLDGSTQHFVDNYAPEPSQLNLNNIMLAYRSAKRYTDTHGIKIYNATRGGALEVFERVDFDSLFEK